jgi:polo-like kinase 4
MPSNESIKDYNVYEQLGQGGFAHVYRAQVKQTGQEVAIKMIDKKQMKASRMTQRVEHEVKIHYQLKHPSILELYTFFEDKNYVYLVLELCHNGEIARYLKSRQSCALDEDEARRFLKQIVDGMIYLHSNGILHRDLSLTNLLLTKDMNVKISDFGLATKLNQSDEKHFTMCGTPNFISPEVASRNPHGLEADLWSLGCMLYTFLVGNPPFDTDGVRNTLNRVMHDTYVEPDYLSPEAKHLIACLLQKNPPDRIQLNKILEHPFMSRKSSNQQPQQQQHQQQFNSNSNSRRAPSPACPTIMNSQIPLINSATTVTSSLSSSNSLKQVVSSVGSGVGNTSSSNNSGGGSFNESIDSGRGTLTTTSTSQRSNSATRTQFNSSSSTSNANVSSLTNATTLNLTNNLNLTTATNSNNSHQDFFLNNSNSSTNLKYNFKPSLLNNQNAPQSPPVKLTSNSPTRDKPYQLHQQHLHHQHQPLHYSSSILNSSNGSCSNNSMSSSTGVVNSSSGHLSRSNTQLNLNSSNTCNAPSSSSTSYQNQIKYIQPNNSNNSNPILNKPVLLSSTISLENLNSNPMMPSSSCLPSTVHKHTTQNQQQQQHFQDMNNLVSASSATLSNTQKPPSTTKTGSKPKSSEDSTQQQPQVSPLKPGSTPLRPTRQTAKNAVLSIMDRNEVVLEIIKLKKNQQYIMEVIRIDAENDLITIYQPNNGKGVPMSNQPPSPPPPNDSTSNSNHSNNYIQCNYRTLPPNYCKKYDLASKFVKMVRSRTPKITLYTDHAKCILYDTSPDFEAQFYASGTKFHISKEGHIKIINHNDNTSITFDSNSRSTCLAPDVQEMLERTHKWHKFCLEEELIREKRKEIYNDIISFPLTIGRKPLQQPLSSNSNLKTQSQQLSSSHPNLTLISSSQNTNNNINSVGSGAPNPTKKISCEEEFTSAYLRSTSNNSLVPQSLNQIKQAALTPLIHQQIQDFGQQQSISSNSHLMRNNHHQQQQPTGSLSSSSSTSSYSLSRPNSSQYSQPNNSYNQTQQHMTTHLNHLNHHHHQYQNPQQQYHASIAQQQQQVQYEFDYNNMRNQVGSIQQQQHNAYSGILYSSSSDQQIQHQQQQQQLIQLQQLKLNR